MRAPSNALSFKRRLLRWFRRAGRRLPWRATRDPYQVLVSEFMLQQTQVARVAEYYPRFLKRYPTVRDLANAAPGHVREAWDGLGYYRRADNLHRLAQAVVKHHDGRVPDRPEVLRTLPGVGPYTAAAVATFAYERRAAPVDTNVARVLRRAFRPRLGNGMRGDRMLRELASAILPRRGKAAWQFNQALMDLGATICEARKPECPVCPVQTACRTGKAGRGRGLGGVSERGSVERAP
ncbi:MAG: A/G-specific adenine glycosylase [Gemmatimonadetes bacterium]|nr:A/G-specific adenine glycosylase [Gemmatimonadota bacterium]